MVLKHSRGGVNYSKKIITIILERPLKKEESNQKKDVDHSKKRADHSKKKERTI